MDEGLSAAELGFEELIGREWLVTNGIGGYASSTIASLNSRRYHGLLVAAMTPPVRRLVILSRAEETLIWQSGRADLACNEYPGTISPRGDQLLRGFSHAPHPRWLYQNGPLTLEKALRLLRGENTVVITYTLLGSTAPVSLELRPLFALRPMHQLGYQWNGRLEAQPRAQGAYHLPATSRSPEVFFSSRGEFNTAPCWYLNTIYRREQERGYGGLEDLWNPGIVRWDLTPGQPVHFICSTDPIDYDRAIEKLLDQTEAATAPPPLQSPAARQLVISSDEAFDALRRAADAFPVAAPRRSDEDAVACIAGYPWLPLSPRATLIGFTGIYLVTGRFSEARALLGKFASRMRDGLMPSELAEDGGEPVYHGADVSLWFAEALYQYIRYSGDLVGVRRSLFDILLQIIDRYRHGAGLGISAGADGLLSTRAAGIPTTWMDAKFGDWVITPRAGRPVELNALWHNALCVASELARRFDFPDRVGELSALARLTRDSFNQRFWNESSGCCFDVVSDHGVDPSVRPNQVLSMSLSFPVLQLDRHQQVLDLVRRELLTPYGLRTLSPREPGYVGRYASNIVSRDRACHNGSVYPWLLGPFVSASLRVVGRGGAARDEARRMLKACMDRLQHEGLGQVPELFDGDAPHAAGGALASAPATGELLRCYAEDVLQIGPVGGAPAEGAIAPFRSPAGNEPRLQNRV